MLSSLMECLEKLSLHENDVLVLHHKADWSPLQAALISSMLTSMRLPCGVIVLREGESIELLPESEMNKLGWFRVQPDAVTQVTNDETQSR